VVKIKAAAHCLSLNIVTEKALNVLKGVAKDESLEIFRFNAEMTLKVYMENGYLKVYPKQEV